MRFFEGGEKENPEKKIIFNKDTEKSAEVAKGLINVEIKGIMPIERKNMEHLSRILDSGNSIFINYDPETGTVTLSPDIKPDVKDGVGKYSWNKLQGKEALGTAKIGKFQPEGLIPEALKDKVDMAIQKALS